MSKKTAAYLNRVVCGFKRVGKLEREWLLQRLLADHHDMILGKHKP